ncbi:MAG TPA: hypothetical protein VM165_18575 [Planctomycetaceae bacterium]|nr:hypothetical protein [Planctomycetaceae bacterium]
MIRIETTAEFDAEGRFTATGQTSSVVTPGPHQVVMLVTEVTDSTAKSDPDTEHRSVLVREGGLLLIGAEALPNADFDIRTLIEADRDERSAHILDGILP